MKKKENDFNFKAFNNAKEALFRLFPSVDKKAFFISDFKKSGLIKNPKLLNQAVSGICELVNERLSLSLRIYRGSGKIDPKYDVDEVWDIDKEIKLVPNKGEIDDHHINCEISEDTMKRNQLTVEYVVDKEGNLRPNIQNNGMIKAFINFEFGDDGNAKRK